MRSGQPLSIAVLLLSAVAMAPGASGSRHPLLAPPLDIGDAKSLPWADPRAWDALDPAYDAGRLAGDTMALLTADAPVIVRMETLRRAVLYSRKDPRTARELQSRLSAHLQVAEENGKTGVLALFDLGYFVDACKQADWLNWDPFVELNGYALVRRALRAGGANPEIEFAAALMLAEPAGQIFFTRHLKFAIAQATEGSLLGRNLVIHFADRGKTLSELKAAKVPRM